MLTESGDAPIGYGETRAPVMRELGSEGCSPHLGIAGDGLPV